MGEVGQNFDRHIIGAKIHLVSYNSYIVMHNGKRQGSPPIVSFMLPLRLQRSIYFNRTGSILDLESIDIF